MKQSDEAYAELQDQKALMDVCTGRELVVVVVVVVVIVVVVVVVVVVPASMPARNTHQGSVFCVLLRLFVSSVSSYTKRMPSLASSSFLSGSSSGCRYISFDGAI